MQELITVNEAAQIIQSNLPKMTTESVALSHAQGRYLRKPILSDRPLPPFNRVMMDGIAICFETWDQGLKAFGIEGTQAAGSPPLKLTSPDACIEVMTGGVLPDGCNCVIPIEEITINKEANQRFACVQNHYTPEIDQHIHRVGSDSPEGEILVPAGTQLNAPELTIAASCGYTHLEVSTLPKITIISTGDELVAPHESPQPYQIRRSHATALHATITSKKLGIVSEKHVADDPAKLKKVLEEALSQNDILILTGGVSRGKYDYVAPVLKDLLGEAHFHGVKQRPGKPLAFWSVSRGDKEEDYKQAGADDGSDVGGEECKRAGADDGSDAGGEECKRAVFALPGNPCSVMACAARYLIPSLIQMLSETPPHMHTLPATGQFNCPPTFTGLISCRLENGTLHLLPPSNSGNFLALAGTHGVAELPGSLTRTDITNHPATFYPWA